MNFKQGIYTPLSPHKYAGDPSKIIYRSSWELFFFKWCDSRENVIMWHSEETIIPYYSPIDEKMHRYFVDARIRMVTNTGIVKDVLIEIKPHAETIKPIPPKNNNRKSLARYEAQCKTFVVNQCKWKAAATWCSKQNMEFIVLTEHHLFPNKGKR